MTYLIPEDFETAIEADELEAIVDGSTTALNSAVEIAIDEAISFIQGRKDMTATFAATGDERNRLFVAMLVDIALYHLCRISPRNIPDLRRDRYAEAIAFLRGVAKNTRFLDIPNTPTNEGEGGSGYIVWGSTPNYDFFG